MTDTTILKALFAQRKLMISQFYKLNKEDSGFSPSYVYAIEHDCYPIFQVDEDDELIYEDLYLIKREKIEELLEYIDEKDNSENYITFYELEDKYGGKKVRYELIVMLRYIALDMRFSDEFWNHLTKSGNAPLEAQNINRL